MCSRFENKETGYSEVADADNWPKDHDALFPIRVGWWYDVLASYITDKTHLVLEGQSDVEIFNAVNLKLEEQNKTTLSSRILCVPGGGNKTNRLISLLRAEDVKIILFQDGDEAGVSRSKQLHHDYDIPYCVTSNFINQKESSIEDLFPKKFFVEIIQKIYPDYNIKEELIGSDQMITNFMDNLCKEKSYPSIDKLKIAIEIKKNIDDIPIETLDIFEKIFKKINKFADELDSQ